jgi:cytochrome c biogenesis protein CcdA
MIKTLIISLSFFGIGVTAYLAAMNVRNAIFLKDRDEKKLETAYAMARVGLVIVVGLITEAVTKAEAPLPLAWRTILYIIGLALVLFGYLGIAFMGRKMRTLKQLRDSIVKPNGRDT